MFKRRQSRDRDYPRTSPHKTLPPPPPSSSTKSYYPAVHHHPIPPRRELLFHTQLAHGSSTKDVKDFSNVKELYSKIAKAFELEPSDIIFCTLNTPKVDMTHLLGGQIGLEDFIFAHIKGNTKIITVTKQEASLGLTITDNGAGNAFIKRIKDGSVASRFPEVAVGDMVVSIDGQNLLGSRHYEVARLLKEFPRYQSFSLCLIEPRKAFVVAPRAPINRPVSKILEDSPSHSLYSHDEPRPSLRLRTDGEATIENVMASWMTSAIQKVDDLLETFMGIRDTALAQVIVELAKDKSTVDDFALAIDNSSLGDFAFPDDFILDMWAAIDSTHTGNV